MKSITIEGQLRSEIGKSATRRLRSEGKVPAVIYGGENNVHFSTTQKDIKPIIYTPEFMLAEITVEGKAHKCILKDMQFDKLTDRIIHVDFLELVDGKKVRATIPLKFTGTAKGVVAGGRFAAKMNAIKVRTLPKNLVESIEIDVTAMDIGDNIRISDIKNDDMEIEHNERIPVCSVALTRILKQEDALGEGAEGVEGEEGAEGAEGGETPAEGGDAPAES